MYNVIPRFIHDACLKGETAGYIRGAVLSLDFSGFTSLTERVMAAGHEGSEHLSAFINRLYEPAMRRVLQSGGFIPGFEGDAFTAILPGSFAPNAPGLGRDLLQLLIRGERSVLPGIETDISARAGLACGRIDWMIAGGEDTLTYCFRGEAIRRCNQALLEADLGGLHEDASVPAAGAMEASDVPRPSRIRPTIAARFVPRSIVDRAFGGEFRDVVAVFVSFEEGLDGESLRSFLELLARSSRDYAGYVSGVHFGDKGPMALVVFGAPRAHENDVDRALAMVSRLREQAAVPVRVGLDTGTCYAGFLGSRRRCCYTVLGDVVNTAARMAVSAPKNQVLLSGSARHRAGKIYNIEPCGGLELRGKSRAVDAYRLLGSYREASMVLDSDRPMVARDRELERLEALVRRAGANGAAEAAYVYGQVGMGKSRLAAELSRRVSPDCSVIVLKSDNVLRDAFNPFVGFLRRYFGQRFGSEQGENREAFESRFDSLLADLEELEDPRAEGIRSELVRMRSVYAGLLGHFEAGTLFEDLDPRQRFQNALYALAELVCALALREPLLMVVEDLHWIDRDSLKVFDVMSQRAAGLPVAIVSTSRYRDDGSRPLLPLSSDIPSEAIQLQRLDDASVDRVSTAILGAAPDAELHEFLMDRGNGNPFFTEQYCHYLRDNSRIEIRNGVSRLGEGRSEIPSGIRAVLISRLDRLDLKLRRAVQTASVLGVEFNARVLSRMLRGERVSSLLDEGEQSRIWASLSELIYMFHHTLLREAAYRMLLASRLRKLHRLAAETIERLYPDDDLYARNLAHHFARADEPLKAIRYLERSVEIATRNYNIHDRIRFLDRLLEYHPWDADVDHIAEAPRRRRHVELLNEKSAVLQQLGRIDDSLAVIDDVLQKSQRIGYHLQKAKAMTTLGSIRCLTDPQSSGEILREALDYYESVGDRQGAADTLGQIGVMYGAQNRFDESEKAFRRAWELFESCSDEYGMGKTAGNLGFLYTNMQEYDRAMEWFGRALHRADRSGNRRLRSIVIGNMGNVYYRQWEMEKAEECFQKRLSDAIRFGEKKGIGVATGNLGNICDRLGRMGKAIEYYSKDLEISTEIQDRTGMLRASLNLGSANLTLDSPERAEEHYSRALEIAQSLSDHYMEAHAIRGLARVKVRMGMLEQALRLNRKRLRMAETHGRIPKLPEAYHDLGRVLLELGRPDEAEQALRQGLDRSREQKLALVEAQCLGLFAELCRRRGDAEGARRFLEEAIDAARGRGTEYVRLKLLMRQSELLIESGDCSGALEAAHSALAQAGILDDESLELEAGILVERAEALRDPRAALKLLKRMLEETEDGRQRALVLHAIAIASRKTVDVEIALRDLRELHAGTPRLRYRRLIGELEAMLP